MVRTDDPFRDFDEWEREQQRKLERLPVCSWCGLRIQEEKALCIGGEWMCGRCEEKHRRYTDEI